LRKRAKAMKRRTFLQAMSAAIALPLARIRARWRPCDHLTSPQFKDFVRAVVASERFDRHTLITVTQQPRLWNVYIDRLVRGATTGTVCTFTIDWTESWTSREHFVRQVEQWTRKAWADVQNTTLFAITYPVTRPRSV